jgi:chaperonin GroES
MPRSDKKTGAAAAEKFRATALHDAVIVKLETQGEQVRGGIIIPATAVKEAPTTGIVQAVGPGREMEPGARSEMSVKEGDRVLFLQFAASPVKIDGEDYVVVRDTDLKAILA